MIKNYISTCYFPSTVMFIDDSRDFLLNFTLQLDPNIAYKLYHSPYDALEAIHAAHQPEYLDHRCLTEYLDTSSCPVNNYTINLDLASIHWEVYNPQRFSEVSVVCIDYAMPGMNGLDFCKKMANSPIKRILLTGKADEKLAVQAFNEGIIDIYLQKQDPDVTNRINEAIKNMQQRYFQSMSDIIVRMLSINSPSCLQDANFIELFNKIITENHIVEYYLTESSGSYLMLDIDGNLSFLIVKNRQDLKLYYEMALDNKAPQKVLDELKSGEKIPYFWHPSDYYQNNWENWHNYLYPAIQLNGNTDYYYAYIKDKPPNAGIQPNKILSYNNYLERLDEMAEE
ncbi:MAG: response regulator [Pseudomonadota bacterium]